MIKEKFIFDLPKNFNIAAYDILSNTNDEAKKLAPAVSVSEIKVVWAKAQTKGKGRQGRDWVSQIGNLFVSFIIKPQEKIEKVSQLSFVSALAVRETIKKFIPGNCAINFKWPNDVLVEGQKISGILLEASLSGKDNIPDWVVAGIGINVKVKPGKLDIPVTSIASENGKDMSVE